ncbi:uncharacterized protein [Spinacia oleracea]|uniref:Helitron helicase-like domain-containing protein n=1 Tax=Spinacia oleracea TaxID=3562 RepID=A0ABM3R596_SPIOL|nr:uncharacterized protein LOC130466069 [Spinacia oleracea]
MILDEEIQMQLEAMEVNQEPTNADLQRERRKRSRMILNEKREQRQLQPVQETTHNQGYLSLGPPEEECPYYSAIMWWEERIKKKSTKKRTFFNMCCQDGKVKLPKFKEPPKLLAKLLNYSGDRGDRSAANFRQLIRMYNSCFALTSMGAKIDASVNTNSGPYVYRVSGQNHHLIGSLLPVDEKRPAFAQLYIYDTASEISNRTEAVCKHNKSPELNSELLSKLKDMFDKMVNQATWYKGQ